ncbi:DUF3889 domain-containing protein [Salirhabdus salicampi]|uniref:DUF3889 domain-containing protein n=1 Tax=Salirhabdus salicampi TaxID=476102 RepID=UPI0020C2C8EB|nr:DUF3889 domain-containing protein [Salirhabdus salicampi]MCP8618136.1 YqzG/YhdC family protein [Salirhabdus salicampi]
MKQVKWGKLLLLLSLVVILLPTVTTYAQPEYAKWGKIAVAETKKQYPTHKVTDYAYQGKVVISDERQQYNFRLSVQANEQQKKDVNVYVLVNPKEDKLLDVYFDEIES